MKVAVTGSTGLIGTALSEHLRESGHEVIPVVRDGSPGINWDIRAGRIDASAFSGIDAVVHLAGAPIANGRWTTSRKEAILQSRVDGTTLLSEALASLDSPPPVLISGSAIGYYGDRGDNQVDEQASKGSGFLADVCEAWETSTAAAEEAGIRVAHLRTGLVLSRSGGLLKKLWKLYRFGLGGRLGSGEQWMSWIHLEDHVSAIEHVMLGELSGAVNLTSPDPVRNSEFNKRMADATRRLAILPIPAFGPKLLFGSELVDELILASTKVAPAKLAQANFSWRYESLTSALTAEALSH